MLLNVLASGSLLLIGLLVCCRIISREKEGWVVDWFMGDLEDESL